MSNKQLVIIRCVEITERVHEMAGQLRDVMPQVEVIAIRDRYGLAPETPEMDRSIRTLDLTDDFISRSGLHYYDDKSRTGWACGDYVLYRALELDWDFAWCIEPDVFLLNGAYSDLASFAELSAELLAVDLGEAGDNWYWTRRIKPYLVNDRFYYMSFPLLRVSRRLAEKGLEVRQRITDKVGVSGRWVPNDESVIGAAVGELGAEPLSLRSVNRGLFGFWSTQRKYPVEDLADNGEPLMVHSGTPRQEWLDYASGKILDGSGLAEDELRSASKATLSDLLKRLPAAYSEKSVSQLSE